MAFLDKMKDSISKGIDTIGAKGKELVEDSEAYIQIKKMQHQREKAIEELGTLALDLFKKGTLMDEGAKKICENITSLDAQIAAKQAEIKEDKA